MGKDYIMEQTNVFTPNYEDLIDICPYTRDLGILFDCKADFCPQRQNIMEEIIRLLPPTTFISYFNKMNSVQPMKIKHMKFAMNDHYLE